MCFSGPGSEKTWKYSEDQPSHQFADGEWGKLALKMICGLTNSTHPVFKCPNTLQAGVLMRRKEGGGAGSHFKNEPETQLTLVRMVLACNQLCLFCAVKNWIRNKMPRIESGRCHSVSSQTTIVGGDLRHHEHSIRAVQAADLCCG